MTGGFEALHFKNVLKKLSVLMALEEIESMFVGFLSTSECFREHQNAVETLACSPCSSAFSFSQTFPRVSITRQKHGPCFLFLENDMASYDLFLFRLKAENSTGRTKSTPFMRDF